jgi:hypothetical protein
MRREEAEIEATRRNRTEPDTDRFEYYAFDESAGLADDAWTVGARLRAGAVTAPATFAGGARREVELEEMPAEPPPEWFEEEAPPPPSRRKGATASRGRRPGRARVDRREARPSPWRTIASQPSLIGRWRQRRRGAAEPVDDERPGLLVRGVGAAVVVVGMLWMFTVVVLAALLKPNGVSGVALYLGAAVLGLLAILLGVAIRRS